MIQEREYAQRREHFAKKLKKNSVAIFFASEPAVRSNDTEYPFRQDSNFYYLTGFKEQKSILVILKKKKKYKTYLFVEKKDKVAELWNGERLGALQAAKLFSVDRVYASDRFEKKISKLASNVKRLYVDFKRKSPLSEKIAKDLQVETLKDGAKIVELMRLIKSPAEIELIKEALKITAKAHHRAMKLSKKLEYEYELQAEIEYVFKKSGAYSDAYTSIVASANSANTLHYIQNNKKLHPQSLILIDAGCEFEYYASDITRTIPVNGRFSKAQKELYSMVLDVEKSIIEMVKPGVLRSDLQKMSEKLLCKGMVKLGILKGSVKKLLKSAKHKKYYPHGIGHWMGIDVHDMAPYKDMDAKELALQKGMVMTIEPGIYIDINDKKVPKKYRGIGIRIEDDILVSKKGYKNLSIAISKEIHEIESYSL